MKRYPKMRGQPVAVCGSLDGRGVVCSASYEARAYGIKSALPVWQCKKLCPSVKLVEVPSEISEYSDAVRRRLNELCPVVETASIDEFFLDFTGCEKIYPLNMDLADKIIKSLSDNPGLPCSVGIGPNKLIAKIASDVAKPSGVIYVFPGSEASFLASLPVKSIPGVGPCFTQKLSDMGIFLVKDVLQLPLHVWRSVFGKRGENLYEQALGLCWSNVLDDSLAAQQKQVSRETTLAEDTTSIEILRTSLSKLVEDAVYDLRRKKLVSGSVCVKIRYSDFSSVSKSISISRTDREDRIFPVALKLFESLYKKRMKIRLVGVKLAEISSDGAVYTLNDFLESYSSEKVADAVDRIRQKYGRNSVSRCRSIMKKS
ncbi:MAG: DNA polymerase IV [Candidatus Riflebacteria bacterium]|nr:DNA polymerase IV [Candidatus Riflebacteria bacterium]